MIFKCTHINIIDNKYHIIFKYISTEQKNGGQRKYKNLKLKNT